MKNIAVVCDVMKEDLEKIVQDKKIKDLEFVFMEQHLHNTPDIMRKKLQEEIDKIDSSNPGYKNIILGYGLCSNGVAGLASKKHNIVIPKVDDCISLFLGSRSAILNFSQKTLPHIISVKAG